MDTPIRRINVSLFSLALTLLCSHSSAETIFVGVGNDAPPFAYKNGHGPAIPNGQGPIRAEGYDGYVVHICDAALRELQEHAGDDLQVTVMEVHPLTRFQFLKSEPAKIDVLCDAVTVTKERLSRTNFGNGLLASSPIYVSGVSFAKLPTSLWPSELCETTILGVVKETTTEAVGVREIADSGVFGLYEESIRKALQTDQDMTRSGTCPGLTIKRAESHSELAELLCDHKLLFYAGDREIVRESIENIRRTSGKDCFYELGPDTYTDERYAVISRVPTSDTAKAALILQFNQILSDLILNRFVLQESFRRSFEAEATVKLKMLFWGLTLETP